MQEANLGVAKKVRKWIVKVKKTVKRRKWEQRIKEQTGKDPMVCPHCQCYYEYKGEVCLNKAHGSLAYFQAAAQKFEDLLEGKIQVKFLEEV